MQVETHKARLKNKDSIGNTIFVALVVSLVCSICVSTTAVMLKPKHRENQLFYSGSKNIVEIIQAIHADISVEEAMRNMEIKLLDIESGQFSGDIDVTEFNAREATSDPGLSIPIPQELDSAGLLRRSRYAAVYLFEENARLKYIILPIYGSGMWSTIYGYLTLEADGNTIAALQFYEHGETPGIGDKIQDPAWLNSWKGKQVYKGQEPVISVVKHKAKQGELYQVDGITGATLTTNGVNNMIHYWLGEHGFLPYLKRYHHTEHEGE